MGFDGGQCVCPPFAGTVRPAIGSEGRGAGRETDRSECEPRPRAPKVRSEPPTGVAGDGDASEAAVSGRTAAFPPAVRRRRRGAASDAPARRGPREAVRASSRVADPRTGVAAGVTRGRNVRSRCRCSMCPAIHINSRSWLRSSSTGEPSDPPHRVVIFVFSSLRSVPRSKRSSDGLPGGRRLGSAPAATLVPVSGAGFASRDLECFFVSFLVTWYRGGGRRRGRGLLASSVSRLFDTWAQVTPALLGHFVGVHTFSPGSADERPSPGTEDGVLAAAYQSTATTPAGHVGRQCFGNDPSAGSPTDTLLRLLLPLFLIICTSSRHARGGFAPAHGTNPRRSLTGTIGSSDGRCVQRAGT